LVNYTNVILTVVLKRW